VSVQGSTAIVRARVRAHLEALQNRFGSDYGALRQTITKTDKRDYGWRIMLPLAAWSHIVEKLAAEQTWSNFKNEAEQFGREQQSAKWEKYVHALHEIWLIMARLQWGNMEQWTKLY
jgi:hypothetical protein